VHAEADPPTVDREPYEQTEAWVEEAFSAPYLTVEAHNAVYEDPDFLAEARPLMPAGVEQSPRAVFTTGLAFSRPPPGQKTTDRLLGIAATYASREFERSLGEDGLLGVTRTGTQELRLRGRRTAKAFGYDAGYPLAEGVGGDGTEERTLDVRVWAAIWATDDSFAMAGGIYPLADLATDGVTVEARPGSDRRRVFDAIRVAAE
jgi:hypothetical protein